MVQERREPPLLIPSCCLTYRSSALSASARLGVRDAFCYRRFPLARPLPSLHPLRGRSPGVVRRLRRYCGPVRLPIVVHRRRTPLDFPTRPATPSVAGDHGTSRLPREVCSYVHGSLTARGSRASRDIDTPNGAFRFLLQRRRPGGSYFRGGIPGPYVPLSTLRRGSCGPLRMTRGRCGSLLLHRMTLSFTTLAGLAWRTGEWR